LKVGAARTKSRSAEDERASDRDSFAERRAGLHLRFTAEELLDNCPAPQGGAEVVLPPGERQARVSELAVLSKGAKELGNMQPPRVSPPEVGMGLCLAVEPALLHLTKAPSTAVRRDRRCRLRGLAFARSEWQPVRAGPSPGGLFWEGPKLPTRSLHPRQEPSRVQTDQCRKASELDEVAQRR